MPWAKRQGSRPIYQTTAHKQARAQLIAAWTPGDPCCLCGQPMHGPTRNLHADHIPGTNQYRGLAHAHCNTRDGARRGRARQNTQQTQLRW